MPDINPEQIKICPMIWITYKLFGNKVLSIDYSEEFTSLAKQLYSKNDFMNIKFDCMDGRNLDSLFGSDFDAVICPMNTIDYAPNLVDRENMLINMYKCIIFIKCRKYTH